MGFPGGGEVGRMGSCVLVEIGSRVGIFYSKNFSLGFTFERNCCVENGHGKRKRERGLDFLLSAFSLNLSLHPLNSSG